MTITDARRAYHDGDFARAARLFDAAGDLDPADRLRRLRLHLLFEDEAAFDKAMATIDDALLDAAAADDPAILQACARSLTRGPDDRVEVFYDAIVRNGLGLRPIALARYVAILVAKGRIDAVIAVAETAEQGRDFDPAVIEHLADRAIAQERLEPADRAFALLNTSGPLSVFARKRLIDLRIAQRRAAETEPVVAAALRELDPHDAAQVALHRTIVMGEAGAARAIAADLPRDLAPVLGDAIAALGYHAIARQDAAVMAAVAAALTAIDSRDPGAVQFAIDHAFARQDYAAAAAAVDRATALFGPDDPMVRLKTAEVRAFEGNLAGAMERIAAMGDLSNLPASHLAPVAMMLAEAGDWARIMTLTGRLDEWFRFTSHAPTLLSAMRALDTWDEVMGATAATEVADLKKLRLVIREIRGGMGQAAALARDPDVPGSGAMGDRLHARADALAISGAARCLPLAARDTVILYCTDSGYLAGALNSIHALLAHNGAFLPSLAIRLYVEPADRERAQAVADDLNRGFGETVEVRSSVELTAGHQGELRTDYGLFTGGLALSRSAYYRIFALRRLLEEPARARALYIDSDTLVLGDVMRAFAVLDGHAPLAARPESDKLEVRRVEKLHGLARGRYFNSGVLAVDLRHADIARLLDATIAETRTPDRLIYHDQCALNRGFRDAVRDLPPAFNSFCLPGALLDAPGPGGVILHFLDRPKPWQPGYDGPLGALWYRHWQAMTRVVSARALADVLAVSGI